MGDDGPDFREPKPLSPEQLAVKAWRKEKKPANFYRQPYLEKPTSTDPTYLRLQDRLLEDIAELGHDNAAFAAREKLHEVVLPLQCSQIASAQCSRCKV